MDSHFLQILETNLMKIICMLLASALTLLQIPTHASDLFTYQGKLTDAQGAALPNGQYRIGVRLWARTPQHLPRIRKMRFPFGRGNTTFRFRLEFSPS